MNRREWLLGSAAVTAATAMAEKPELWPCINQQTTLDAPFEAECAAWTSADLKRVELWFPKLRKLNLAPAEIAGSLRDAGLCRFPPARPMEGSAVRGTISRRI